MIKIGITGHRNLKEVCMPYYRSIVYKMLTSLKEKHDELLIYSALAEGADRLVVEVARELNIEYFAVLPMPKDIYMANYDEVSKITYNILFDNATSIVKIPLIGSNTLISISNDLEAKNLQYEAAGHYLSDHCDILMALWDGEYLQLKGGTSEVVKYHLAKVYYSLYHLLVSRSKGLTKEMVEFKIFEK